MTAIREIWRLPVGRLAIACMAIGILGLTVHYWAPVLALVALPRKVNWYA